MNSSLQELIFTLSQLIRLTEDTKSWFPRRRSTSTRNQLILSTTRRDMLITLTVLLKREPQLARTGSLFITTQFLVITHMSSQPPTLTPLLSTTHTLSMILQSPQLLLSFTIQWFQLIISTTLYNMLNTTATAMHPVMSPTLSHSTRMMSTAITRSPLTTTTPPAIPRLLPLLSQLYLPTAVTTLDSLEMSMTTATKSTLQASTRSTMMAITPNWTTLTTPAMTECRFSMPRIMRSDQHLTTLITILTQCSTPFVISTLRSLTRHSQSSTPLPLPLRRPLTTMPRWILTSLPTMLPSSMLSLIRVSQSRESSQSMDALAQSLRSRNDYRHETPLNEIKCIMFHSNNLTILNIFYSYLYTL